MAEQVWLWVSLPAPMGVAWLCFVLHCTWGAAYYSVRKVCSCNAEAVTGADPGERCPPAPGREVSGGGAGGLRLCSSRSRVPSQLTLTSVTLWPELAPLRACSEVGGLLIHVLIQCLIVMKVSVAVWG